MASLYTSPASLAIGAACGVVSACYVAFITYSQLLYILTSLITVVAVWRVIAAQVIISGKSGTGHRMSERLYELGAWLYAGLLGSHAAATLQLADNVYLHVLMAANAIGYGAGISARNAGRPAIAIGQTMLSTLPMGFVCIISPVTAYNVLSVTILLFAVAMTGITLNTFRVVRESYEQADQNRRLADKMRDLARTDVVTGLLNRAGMNARLIDRYSRRDNNPIDIVWVDLDRFKEINDTLGHAVGDRLLTEIAKRLTRFAREGDIVARFGGDEFILVTNRRPNTERLAFAEELLAQLIRPISIDTTRLEIGASIGIATASPDQDDLETAMKNADLALYHSKVNGRCQFNFYRPEMNRDLVRRREIEADLRGAIGRNEMEVHYQPIVDLNSGKIRSFEALLRWTHPEKGYMRPDEFIPVAESSGMIITIGNWVTSQACQAAMQWPEDVSICVNISPAQMRAPGAALAVMRAVKSSGIAPSRLELEVTENMVIDDTGPIRAFMNTLTEHGVRFAMDDFGTGYSSLTYLQNYSFSKIKIDKSFVSGPKAGRKSDAIIRAIAELANTLEMAIVAEGIETIDHAKAVKAAGCSLGQGYYFCKAVPLPETNSLFEVEDRRSSLA